MTGWRHRLVVGDSTDPAVVARALDGHAPDLMIMDPPFQMDYSAWSIPESVEVLMVWGRGEQHFRYGAALASKGWKVHEYVICGQPHHYPILGAPCVLHVAVSIWRCDRFRLHPFDQQTLSNGAVDVAESPSSGKAADTGRRPKSIQRGGGYASGPTATSKPFVAFAVAYSYLSPGALVWDPCAGSGSSLIAAERLGYRWIGCEHESAMADLAIQRWQREASAEARPEPDDGRRVVSSPSPSRRHTDERRCQP